jgi:predicted RNase H-like HicB family nuclease
MAKAELTAIIKEAEEGGYIAYCPALKGCITQGETLEEVKRNIKEAVCMYIDELRESQFQDYITSLVKKNYEKASIIEKKEEDIRTIPISCAPMLAGAGA